MTQDLIVLNDSRFNSFNIDKNNLEKNSVNICLNCVDKFMNWQQEIYAKLFPTKAAKRMYEKS